MPILKRFYHTFTRVDNKLSWADLGALAAACAFIVVNRRYIVIYSDCALGTNPLTQPTADAANVAYLAQFSASEM